MPRTKATLSSDCHRHILQMGKGEAVVGEVPEARTATPLPFRCPQTGFPETQGPDVEEGGHQGFKMSDWRQKGK